MNPEWRSKCTVMSVGPALQEIANYGEAFQYARVAERYPMIIFMEVEPGYFK